MGVTFQKIGCGQPKSSASHSPTTSNLLPRDYIMFVIVVVQIYMVNK